MIELEFYEMQEGAIGEFLYLYHQPFEISDEIKDNVMLQSASIKVQEFLLKQLHGMGKPGDGNSIYSDSRKFAKRAIDDAEKREMIKRIDVQVGNKESYDEIIKIESDKNFKSWIDEITVKAFKENYESRFR